jgi:esterase
VVADIAPARYPPAFAGYAAAMAAIPLAPGLTRRSADAALHEAVPLASVRSFLLQNLRTDDPPAWKIGLADIAAALPDIQDWPAELAPGRHAPYPGPALFIAGEYSDYIAPRHRPAIAALFPAARHITLKQAGHWLHADNPEGFAAILSAFLDALD